MPNPNAPSWYEHLRGKRTKDINLPNESGMIDPRLESSISPDERKKAFDAGQSKALEGLRKAGN